MSLRRRGGPPDDVRRNGNVNGDGDSVAVGSKAPNGQAGGPVPGRLSEEGQKARRGGGPPWMGAAMPAEKSMNFGPSAKRLLRRLYPQWPRVAVVLALAVLSTVTRVVGPLILGRATNVIFAGIIGKRLPAGMTKAEAVHAARAAGKANYAKLIGAMNVVPGHGIDFHRLAVILGFALALFVVSSLFGWLQGYVLNDAVQAVVYRLREDVEEKLHRLPLQYFDRQPRGELLSRVTNDIDNISQTLQQTLSQLLTALLTVLGVVIFMFVLSPVLALIALVTIPASMVLTKQIAKRSQKMFITQWAETGSLNAQVEEAFTGHALVKVFGRQREVEESFGATNEKLFKASFGAQFISGIIMPVMMFLGNLNYVIIAVIGGVWVTTGAMTLGGVQAFIQYSRQFTQPLTQVASMANLLQSGVASAERVFDLLDADEQVPDSADSVTVSRPRGRIELQDVSFRYEPDQPLIEDLSLVAEPGHTVAIVGPTGAGKTTLVNLIMRFYELDRGRITLDGVDVATMRRQDLRSNIGMVLQDTWLFEGTIRDNIAYGNPGATEEEILAAAKATYVDRFVHSLPEGYDTVIDEEGSTVSAGEKQLLTIARAFLANPSLLILDEATSSVDTRTEVLVQHAMAALRSDRTSFVIAHRLSTIRDADLILMMEHGRIVEQGTHDELLAARGAYFRLYSAQFEGALSDEDGTGAGDGTPVKVG